MGAGDLDGAERLARRGLEQVPPGDELGRERCRAALGEVAHFRGDYDRGRSLLVGVGGSRARPEALSQAALSAAYAGDLDEARQLNATAEASVSGPSLLGFCRYVAAEIDGVAGDWATAERHYREALDLAARSGATFLEEIASVGLVSVLAAGGQWPDALVGYRDLIDCWERTGGWTQQWTTLRNLALLLDDLGDDETAARLRSAADQAPEAAALSAAGDRDGDETDPGFAPSREATLDVARDAIDRALASTVAPA